MELGCRPDTLAGRAPTRIGYTLVIELEKVGSRASGFAAVEFETNKMSQLGVVAVEHLISECAACHGKF
jgi:hypothetical protein